MLSVAPMAGSSRGEYYVNLAQEDYYTQGAEPPGKWFGSGAEFLGLTGLLDKEKFIQILQGFDPENPNRLLVQNAGNPDRQSGWDLTYSAPKSVSVLWSQVDDLTRKEIEKAHEDAVKSAMSYLEENAAFTRRGKGGCIHERSTLVCALFEHSTSRELDPQLHTHALILNASIREDGTTGTILSKPFYEHKMTAGALYRAELAYQLEQRLGLEVERKKSWFEIKGVSETLVKEFSKRRAQIELMLKETGFQTAHASQVATLATRAQKDYAPRDLLLQKWKQIAQEHGWNQTQAQGLITKKPIARNIEKEARRVLAGALNRITEQKNHFTEKDFIRYVAEESQGRGLGAELAISTARNYLSNSKRLVPLQAPQVTRTYDQYEPRFTTKVNLEMEKRLLDYVYKSVQPIAGKPVKNHIREELIARDKLTPEQAKAVNHITSDQGRIKVVTGMAGTGKTHMLKTAKEVWEKSGYQVYGVALAGKAARGLEEGAGIKSQTTTKLLLQHGVLPDMKLNPIKKAQMLIAGSKDPGRFSINKNTVLVVDEAAMLDTKTMSHLVKLTQKNNAQLILVGDGRQLQPVGLGGPFNSIAERLGDTKLTEIRRQKEEWAKQTVHSFADGRAEDGLKELNKRGFVKVEESRGNAIISLVRDWRKEGTKSPKDHLILATTNEDTKTINKLCQRESKNAGRLSGLRIPSDHTWAYKGDRIVFNENSKFYGVSNGSLGTITAVRPLKEQFDARLDSGETVSISWKNYRDFDLGYAVTTHKAQGMTVNNAYILAGGMMQDRELSYVQVSRARNETRIYTDKVTAGPNLETLAKQMKVSHQKDLALDHHAPYARKPVAPVAVAPVSVARSKPNPSPKPEPPKVPPSPAPPRTEPQPQRGIGINR